MEEKEEVRKEEYNKQFKKTIEDNFFKALDDILNKKSPQRETA